MIWIVGGDLHFGWIGFLRSVKGAVCLIEINLGVKWLMRFQVVPVRCIKWLAGVTKVPVGFARDFEDERGGQFYNIGGEVTGVTHPVGEDSHAVRQRFLVHGPMVVRADGGGVHARHERRAAGRTYHPREEPCVTHAFGGHAIEIRSPDFCGAITAELWSEILSD